MVCRISLGGYALVCIEEVRNRHVKLGKSYPTRDQSITEITTIAQNLLDVGEFEIIE